MIGFALRRESRVISRGHGRPCSQPEEELAALSTGWGGGGEWSEFRNISAFIL